MRWMGSLTWVLGAALLALAGCNDTPERVADHFVDFYFVEIDQARARPLTTGLASRKLDDELHLVESIRQTYEPDQAKPSIFYVRQGLSLRGERARATYDLTIRRGGDDESHRQVLVSLERVDRRWKVGNFLISEGQPPVGEGPAASGPPSPSRVAVPPPAVPGTSPPVPKDAPAR